MPRIKPLELEEKRRAIRATIDYCARKKGEKPKHYIQRTGLKRSASENRYNRPEEFKIIELWSMGVEFSESDLKILFPKRDTK